MVYEQSPLFADLPPVVEQVSKETTKPEKPAKPKGNPCIAVYGPGPDDTRCGDCALLVGWCRATLAYKCRVRSTRNSPGGDHKLKWPACSKFEQRMKDIPLYDSRG